MNRLRPLICLGSLAVLTAFGQTLPPPSPARFLFREPDPMAYRLEQSDSTDSGAATRSGWVRAWQETDPRRPVEFGRRVALRLKPGTDIRAVLEGSSLKFSRTVAA